MITYWSNEDLVVYEDILGSTHWFLGLLSEIRAWACAVVGFFYANIILTKLNPAIWGHSNFSWKLQGSLKEDQL